MAAQSESERTSLLPAGMLEQTAAQRPAETGAGSQHGQVARPRSMTSLPSRDNVVDVVNALYEDNEHSKQKLVAQAKRIEEFSVTQEVLEKANANHTNKISALQRENQDLKNRKDMYKSEAKKRADEKSELQKQISNLGEQISSLGEYALQSQKLYENLKRSKSTVEEALVVAQRESHEWRQAHESITKERDESRDRSSKRRKELADLANQNADLLSEVADLNKERKSQIAELNTTLEKEKARTVEFQKQVPVAQNAKAVVDAELTRLREEVEAAELSLATMGDAAAMKHNVFEMTCGLMAQSMTEADDIAYITAHMQDLERGQAARAQAKAAEQSLQSRGREIWNLKNQLKIAKDDLHSANSKVKMQRETLHSRAAEMAQMKQTAIDSDAGWGIRLATSEQEAKSTKQDLETQLAAVKDDLLSANKQVETQTKKSESLAAYISRVEPKARKINTELKEKLGTSKKEVERLNQDLRRMSRKRYMHHWHEMFLSESLAQENVEFVQQFYHSVPDSRVEVVIGGLVYPRPIERQCEGIGAAVEAERAPQDSVLCSSHTIVAEELSNRPWILSVVNSTEADLEEVRNVNPFTYLDDIYGTPAAHRKELVQKATYPSDVASSVEDSGALPLLKSSQASGLVYEGSMTASRGPLPRADSVLGKQPQQVPPVAVMSSAVSLQPQLPGTTSLKRPAPSNDDVLARAPKGPRVSEQSTPYGARSRRPRLTES